MVNKVHTYIHTTTLCPLAGEALSGILTGKLLILGGSYKKLSHPPHSTEVKFATLRYFCRVLLQN